MKKIQYTTNRASKNQIIIRSLGDLTANVVYSKMGGHAFEYQVWTDIINSISKKYGNLDLSEKIEIKIIAK